MSVVSCSFPLSPSGFAIDACSTNVRIAKRTVEDTHCSLTSGTWYCERTSVFTNASFSTRSFMYGDAPAPPMGSARAAKSIRCSLAVIAASSRRTAARSGSTILSKASCSFYWGSPVA